MFLICIQNIYTEYMDRVLIHCKNLSGQIDNFLVISTFQYSVI